MRTTAIGWPSTTNRRASPSGTSSTAQRRCSLTHDRCAPSSAARSSLAPISARTCSRSGGDRHAGEHLVEEAGDDQPLGDARRHASALEVEALLVVDRADRRGVAAADVVVLDLEVRHRLGPRVLGQLEVAVGLEGVGAPGLLPDPDEAGVDRPGVAAHRPLEQQVGGGVGRPVVLERAEVEVLVGLAEVGGQQVAGGAPALEAAVGAEPGVVAAEHRRRADQRGVLARPSRSGWRSATCSARAAAR